MLVVDLHCEHGHQFEGWFASADDLSAQQARGLVSCPVCGSVSVTRRPSAPRLNVSGLRESPVRAKPADAEVPAESGAPMPAEAAEAVQALQAMYLHAVRQVVANTEDVGERFADEARRMHYGDTPERAIRGQASPQQREELRDEGIEVLSLPIPAALKDPLQ